MVAKGKSFRGQRAMWVTAALLLALSAMPAAAQTRRVDGGHTGDYFSVHAITGLGTVEDPSADTGYPRLHDDSGLSSGLGAALGYNWAKKGLPVRSEIEFEYRTGMEYDVRIPGQANYLDSVSNTVLLLNAYYDFELSRNWTFYAGGGLGWAHNMDDVDRVSQTGGGVTNIHDSSDTLAIDLALGAIWQVGASWDLDFRYRYLNLGEQSFGPHTDGTNVKARTFYTQDFMLGLVHRF